MRNVRNDVLADGDAVALVGAFQGGVPLDAGAAGVVDAGLVVPVAGLVVDLPRLDVGGTNAGRQGGDTAGQLERGRVAHGEGRNEVELPILVFARMPETRGRALG